MPENQIIVDAVSALPDDPGAVYGPEVLEALRKLKTEHPPEFARIRALVKRSKVVKMADFDKQTAPVKTDSGCDLFAEVEPFASPVSGALLLDDIVAQLKRFVVADESTLRAAALWCVHTWLMDAVQVSPIANITAPELRCGKTTLLSAMGYLAARPINTSNISPAALFRSIEQWQPTLMIDEVDSFLRDNEDARGILNAGFTRDSAYIIRCVGDDHQPERFRVWGAKALCGIGSLASTLRDRSIPLQMRRKLPHETAERLRHSDPMEWEQLQSRMARWAEDNKREVATARPDDIPGLNDRAQDCWEPLLQIAEVAGGHWPGIARRTAIALHGAEEDAPSVGVELLRDIQTVFDTQRVDRLSSADLIASLTEDEEAPWATWNRGKPLTARQLANRLGEFAITSNTIRIGSSTAKGYRREQFADAFKRYLSADTPATSVTLSQASDGAACSNSQSVTPPPCVTDKNSPQPSNGGHCDNVTDTAEGWGTF